MTWHQGTDAVFCVGRKDGGGGAAEGMRYHGHCSVGPAWRWGGLVRVVPPAWYFLSVLEGFLHEGYETGKAPGDPSGSLQDS